MLATLNESGHENVHGVGELGRVVKRRDLGRVLMLTQIYLSLMQRIFSLGRGSLEGPCGTGLPSGGEDPLDGVVPVLS